MAYERIEQDGTLFAEVIWAGTTVEKSRFFSDEKSSLQFGLLAHEAGFIEPAHYHHPINREISDLQQMFVVQRGVVAVDFYAADGVKFHEVVLRVGDAINLVHGVHAVRVIEDMQCVSVKQGPFFGDKLDKVNVNTK
jgi:anti-sigma factor ChrR (cupin superfamily)